ncbi:MAG: membrane integrity-associated transporter subunit PqiC [Chromatiales bacterium]|jgi:uncharacterized lipoprotein YmbA|nr:membrane integrity-associated transporter subunit PqiC [Chromatiales bacterium]
MDTTLRAMLLVAVALAAACASSPPPRYYRLVAEAAPAAAADGPAVIVGPFQLAEYLARPQIVAQADANRMTINDFERWAEPLDANFQSVVTANVGRLLGSDTVLEFPAQKILKDARRVSGRVMRFDIDATGEAVLEVQWGVVDAAGNVVRPGRVSRYTKATGNGSTAAGVAALNATVAAFSADVAAALRAIP